MQQQTLAIIKPDGVSRGLIGSIISEYEKKPLKIKNIRMLKMSYEIAKTHYEEHINKDFFPSLMEYITSGESVVLMIEGQDAITAVRDINHDIRSRFGISPTINTVHGSDSEESAKREICHFFES